MGWGRKLFYCSCIICLLAAVGMLFPDKAVYAFLRLSVNPIDGGNSLRFGRVDIPSSINREVNIRVNSSNSEQYQVFQRLSEPLVNERGESIDRDVIVAATITGSNSAGTLYAESPEEVGFSDRLIYTSNVNGDGDSFTIVYQVLAEKLTASGNFFGKILYTVRPIGGGPQDEVVLNIFLDASEEFELHTETSSGLDTIRLSSQATLSQEGYARISFQGNRGRELKIYQEIVQMPLNELNNEIGTDTVTFHASGGAQGELSYQTPSALQGQRVLLYSSREPEDMVEVRFRLDAEQAKREKAGDYQGQLRYIIEHDLVEQFYVVDFHINIMPVFELEVQYPPGGVNFSKILLNSPPQTREVFVKVHSNLGKPYIVHQDVTAPLSNEKGDTVPNEYFTVREELLEDISGSIEASEFQPVLEGSSALFTSNAAGSPAEFKVIYRLRPFKAMQPGNYETAIVYSLSEI